MRLVLSLTLIVVLAACASPESRLTESGTPETSVEATPSPEATPTMEPITRESLIPASERPKAEGGGIELVGTLGADSVEGGCGYLEAPNGTRYQVIYPDGWQLQLSPLQLTSPEGEVVARGGDKVTVRGSEASDMVSICQIGPMFRASEVVSVD
jgi:hypothetical protein